MNRFLYAMRRPIITIIITLLFLSAGIQEAWSGASRAFDPAIRTVRIAGEQTAGGFPEDLTETATVVDFSSMTRASHAELCYIRMADSILMEMLPDMRCDYALDNGVAQWRCLEGRTWRMVPDTSATKHMTACDSITLRLTADVSRAALFRGRQSMHAASGITMIFESGDTITNAEMRTFGIEGMAYPASYDFLRIESSGSPAVISRIYWFCPGSPYPVAIGRRMSIEGMVEIEDVLLFPLQGHPAIDMGNAVAISPGNMLPDSRGAVPASRILSQEHLNIDVIGHDATVTFAGDIAQVALAMAEVRMTLCDVAGRVYPAAVVDGGVYKFLNLRPGEYLLTLLTDNGVLTRKFIILSD